RAALKSGGRARVRERARGAALPTLSSPERREKIAASKRGQARQAHVVEAVREAHAGTKHTEEARAKMSRAHRRRGTRPPAAGEPWTAREDEAVRTKTPTEAVKATGRALAAVYSRRGGPGPSDGRAVRPVPGFCLR